MERGLLGATGIGMALVSGFFTAYFVGDLASSTPENTPGIDVGLVIMFGGLLAVGVAMAYWAFFKRPSASGAARPGTGGTGGQDAAPTRPATPAEREHRVLLLAEQHHGRVTVPEVAAHCGLTIAEAKAELDRLAAAQVADLQVTSGGVLVYVFSGFLSDEDKRHATDF
jgi:hypothetical protein